MKMPRRVTPLRSGLAFAELGKSLQPDSACLLHDTPTGARDPADPDDAWTVCGWNPHLATPIATGFQWFIFLNSVFPGGRGRT